MPTYIGIWIDRRPAHIVGLTKALSTNDRYIQTIETIDSEFKTVFTRRFLAEHPTFGYSKFIKPMEEKMKTKNVVGKILALILVLGLLFAAGAVAADMAITGIVDQNDSGAFIILGDDGDDYLVSGRDLSDMVGKTVKVTGTIAEDADVKSITVMDLEEIEE